MIVMFVRQELMQQNLTSDQHGSFRGYIRLSSNKQDSTFKSTKQDSCQKGVTRMVDTGVKMGKLEVALMVLGSKNQEGWVKQAFPRTVTLHSIVASAT